MEKVKRTIMFSFVLSFLFSCGGIKKDNWKTTNVIENKDKRIRIAGFYDEDFGITIGYDGDKYYTLDGGQSWKAGKNKSYCRFGLEILNKNKAWSCGNKGNIRVTDDGGKTWQKLKDFGPSEPRHCRYIDFVNDNDGWIASLNILAKTGNGGKSWQGLTLPESIGEILAINLSKKDSGFLLDNKGIIFKTSDSGNSWEKIDLGLQLDNYFLLPTHASSSIMKFNNENGIVILRQVKPEAQILVLYTKDGGKTWNPKAIPYEPPEDQGYNILWEYHMFLSEDWKYLTISAGPNGNSKYITIMENQNI